MFYLIYSTIDILHNIFLFSFFTEYFSLRIFLSSIFFNISNIFMFLLFVCVCNLLSFLKVGIFNSLSAGFQNAMTLRIGGLLLSFSNDIFH